MSIVGPHSGKKHGAQSRSNGAATVSSEDFDGHLLRIGTLVTGLLVDIDKAEVVKLKSSSNVDSSLRVQFTCIPAPTLKKILSALADTIKSNAVRIAQENEAIRHDHRERMLAEYQNDRRLTLLEKRLDALMKAQKRAKFTAHRQYRDAEHVRGNNAAALSAEARDQERFGGSGAAEDSWHHHISHANQAAINRAREAVAGDSTVPSSVKLFIEALTSSGDSHHNNAHNDGSGYDDDAEAYEDGHNDDDDDDWTEFKEVHYRLDKLEERQEKFKALPRWCKTLENDLHTLEKRVNTHGEQIARIQEDNSRLVHQFQNFRLLFESHEGSVREDFTAVRDDASDLRDQIESVRRGVQDRVPVHDMPKKANVVDVSNVQHDVARMEREFKLRQESAANINAADLETLRADLRELSKDLQRQQAETREYMALETCGWCSSCGQGKIFPQQHELVAHDRHMAESGNAHARVPQRPKTGHGGKTSWDSSNTNTGESENELEKLALSLRVGTALVSPSPAQNRLSGAPLQKENTTNQSSPVSTPRQRARGERTEAYFAAKPDASWNVRNGIASPPKYESGPPRDHRHPIPIPEGAQAQNARIGTSAWTGKMNRSWQTGEWTSTASRPGSAAPLMSPTAT